jgi:hypothetical protein
MAAFTEELRPFGILYKPIFCNGDISIKLREPESKTPEVKGQWSGKRR